MSNDTPPSPVTRLVPPLTIIALVVMVSAAVFHVATMKAPDAPAFSRETAPAAADYAGTAGWHTRPEGERDGGWERPWPVDLIWFPANPGGFMGGWNIPLDWAGISDEKSVPAWIASAESAGADLFVPRRRFAAEAVGEEMDRARAQELEIEDALSAADQYLTNDHSLRGLFIGGENDGVAVALEIYDLRLRGTLPFDNLFGGLIIGSETDIAPTELPDWPNCADEAQYPCIIDLRGLDVEAAGGAVADGVSRFSQWLDAEVPKPAAPLPPFETIELAPINRPDHEL